MARARQAGEVVLVEKPLPALFVVPAKAVTCGFGVAFNQEDDPFNPFK